MLTQARLRALLSYDSETGVFRRRFDHLPCKKAGDEAGGVSPGGYVVIRVDGRHYSAQRLAWLHVYGAFPDGVVDHKNQIKTDNRLSNLRVASRAENGRNRRVSKANSSGVTGVRWHRSHRKWQAEIRVNWKLIHLGYFADIQTAVAARRAAELKHFGEFAPQAA